MSKFGAYYARITGVRNDLTGLPPWARFIFGVVVIPGIVLVGLSIVLLLVSIAALLFLAIPVYMLLRAITVSPLENEGAVVYDPGPDRPEARRIEATMLDEGHQAPDEVNGE